jgi:hypothetical protein
MALIIHLIIAFSSLIFSGYVFFVPSRTKLHISYAFVAATLASGTYLVVSTHSPLLSSCMSGLTYLAVVMSGQYAAYRKLSREQ